MAGFHLLTSFAGKLAAVVVVVVVLLLLLFAFIVSLCLSVVVLCLCRMQSTLLGNTFNTNKHNWPKGLQTKEFMAARKKWSEEKREAICNAIAGGMTHKGAALANGISESEFYAERRRNPVFNQSVQRADGASEAMLVQLALKGAKRDGRVALMILERRFAGWQKQVHVSGQVRHEHTLNRLVDMRAQRDRQIHGADCGTRSYVVECGPNVGIRNGAVQLGEDRHPPISVSRLSNPPSKTAPPKKVASTYIDVASSDVTDVDDDVLDDDPDDADETQ